MISYRQLKRHFHKLLTSLDAVFCPEEIKAVQEFIETKEYGLAFETVCDIIRERQKRISAESFELLAALGMKMHVDVDRWAGLRGHVRKG